jgi:hypothetical protein
MKSMAQGVVILLLPLAATAATWSGGGGADKAWTNTANWTSNPSFYPGISGGDTVAAIANGGTANLSSPLPTLTSVTVYGKFHVEHP